MRHVPKLIALCAAAAVTLTSTAGLASAVTPTVASVSAVTPVWGTYQSVPPARVLDTRGDPGVTNAAPIGPAQTLGLSILGRAGVPTTGVSAVVLNLTVSAATRSSYLTAWQAGTARPNVSSINFPIDTTRANLVTVQLGTVGSDAGKVNLYNYAGNVHVIADVLGYYVADAATTAGGLYQSVVPQRLLDTRTSGGPLGALEAVSVPVSYSDEVADANPHISALAVTITAVSPTGSGHLTAWDGTGDPPETSTLNFAPRTVTPNMAIVPVAPCVDCGTDTGLPSITVINGSGGTVNVLVDIVGFYDDGQLVDRTGQPIDGARFKPLRTPTRIVDTRSSTGTTTFKGRGTKSVFAPGTVAGPEAVSLVTNTTAVKPTLATYLTLWPDLAVLDFPRPVVSNINAVKGQIVANATITDLGIDSTFTRSPFSIYNDTGTVDVLVDVVGTMELLPVAAAPAAGAPAAGAKRSSTPERRTWTSKTAAQPAR